MNCEDVKTPALIVGFLAFFFVLFALFSVKAVALFSENQMEVFVTFQNTIGGVLNERGISAESSDRVFIKPQGFVVENLSQRISSGSKIEFLKAEPIVIQFDGVRRQLFTTKKNLRNAVAKLGIKLGSLDRVEVSEDKFNPGTMITRVVRVEHKIVERSERIPYEIDYVPNNQISQGKVVVWKPGSGGAREDSYREVYEDGKLVSSTFVSTRVSQKPIHEEICIGQAELPGGTLAVLEMDSTAYTPTVEECDADPWTTATGMRSGYGIVAIDPSEIPYHTKMYIEGYGYAIAGDCGGAIKKNRLDVFFYKKEEAYRWGRRKVKVYVLEWPQGTKIRP